jgi:hypothetical protein
VAGKKVYSDKELTSVVGTRLGFADGSWCNVATGQIVNKGPGYINVGAPEEGETQSEARGPEVFDARSLEVRDLSADLDIQVHGRDEIEVTMEGSAGKLKNIKLSQDRGVVSIEDIASGGGVASGLTVISGGGRSITRARGAVGIVGGSVRAHNIVVRNGRLNVASGGSSITVGSGRGTTRITVKVPKGAAVSISGVDGGTIIGDTEGPLNVGTNTSCDVSAGLVRAAVLNVQGSAGVFVAEVKDTLSASVQGSGTVDVRGGHVSTLSASVQGSGDIQFDGTAENATLTVMGSGGIRVNHIVNRPVKSVMGSGDIRVLNW